MGRYTDALMNPSVGYAIGSSQPMLDLKYGGTMGYVPGYADWVSYTQYVRHNLLCYLVEPPKGFSLLQDGDTFTTTLKSLVEVHALSVTGLNAGLTVEVAETPIGGAGERQQDPTNVTREVSNVVFRINEKYGRPVQKFLESWITNLIMDPNSKYANIATVAGGINDLLSDMYSAVMLFIEPDPSLTKVNKAWLGANMFPMSTGEITGAKDMTAPGETLTYDIPFAGFFQYGKGVDAFALQILKTIALTGANPQERPAFVQNIDPSVLAIAQGYNGSVQGLGQGGVPQTGVSIVDGQLSG